MIKTALLSVYDKQGILQLGRHLLDHNVTILSSGGTYKHLEKTLSDHKNINLLTKISDYTEHPEFIGGRVKTLHPKIHGGILAQRSLTKDLNDLKNLNISEIDLVVVNLYPFKETVNTVNVKYSEVIEQIDIGGHTLIRSAAKNHNDVLVVTDPDDYSDVIDNWNFINKEFKQKYALKAFKHILEYDIDIYNYFSTVDVNNKNNMLIPNVINRTYQLYKPLKYGCNPQQNQSGMYLPSGESQPFTILNGNPGYINILDAVGSWNLVKDLKQSLNLPSAASFKHTSPAGSSVYCPLTENEAAAYLVDPNSKEYDEICNSKLAVAFIRARNADPKSSFGDFIALSNKVDKITAKLISREVSDGIIAPDFSDDALEILKKKKKGAYIILKGQWNSGDVNMELREFHGVCLTQNENTKMTNKNLFTFGNGNGNNNKYKFTEDEIRDMIVANTTLKYTQSNSVALAKNGQCIGIAAGQQSRIDCVKLCRKKAITWWCRQNKYCLKLLKCFKPGTKRLVKINSIIQFIEASYEFKGFSQKEFQNWLDNYVTQSLIDNGFSFVDLAIGFDKLTQYDHVQTLNDVSLASDAFFPFRDNIDEASKIGVKNIIQPGGSIRDEDIIKACEEYNMKMLMTGKEMRMFLH